MSAFEVAFPPLCPLWHEAREDISASTINRAAIPIRFRIENNSRTNGGCKRVFDQAIESVIGETHHRALQRGSKRSLLARALGELWVPTAAGQKNNVSVSESESWLGAHRVPETHWPPM